MIDKKPGEVTYSVYRNKDGKWVYEAAFFTLSEAEKYITAQKTEQFPKLYL